MIKNYKEIEHKYIKELNALGQLFIHEKSGARVVCLTNDDVNKTFSIAFRTPPNDDTGLPHILEHSVLCGSRKFPIKDPFVELAKGSLNTFLNAMTFSDKTVYPVASCNDKDFENLMDVYLDAVFFPNIYKEDKILKQEGWHYELTDPDADVTYKGVVYNEMKGAFSSPEQVLFRKIQQSLFPDNAYHFESGGDPDFITDLTQEDFLNFHKKYYHPSNSYIFLYGQIDVADKLNWLHTHYLNDFEQIEVDSVILKQEGFAAMKEVTFDYPVSSNESLDEKTYLSMNFAVGDALSQTEYIGVEVLEYILLEAQGAPLKKALLDAGIGKDVFGSYDNGILQPTFSIVVKNSEADKKDAFIKVIQETLKKIVKEGLEPKKIRAAINYFEFKTREADFGRYPKGVIYALKALDSWLYEASPFLHFEYDETFDVLKEGATQGYFTGLIEKYLLGNNHASLLILRPNLEMMNEKEAETKEKLANYQGTLSGKAIKKLIKATQALEAFQNEEETQKNLESIPLLDVADINKTVERLEIKENTVEKITLLHHETFTNNIIYTQLNFNTKHVQEAHIPYLGLLAAILGKMNTQNYEYSDLASEINLHTGSIRFHMNVHGVAGDEAAYTPNFEVGGKYFSENGAKFYELVTEMLTRTIFDDKVRLREIISENKSRVQMGLSSNGHATAANRCEGYFSEGALYRDLISGIAYAQFLEKCEGDFNAYGEDIINALKHIVQVVFRPENLIVGTTCEEKAYASVAFALEKFKAGLFSEPIEAVTVVLKPEQKNEGFMTSGKVQYVATTGNYFKAGFKYKGELRVLQTILSLDYLWHNVRVKGGAYGCMANFKRSGSLYFVSYRDPNLTETLNIYDQMAQYIETFSADEREMRKYILGTISTLDTPLTPSMKNERMHALYFSGISHEDLQLERDQVIYATKAEICALAPLIRETLKQNNICVIGNENKIMAEKALFKEVIHLIN